MSRNAVTAIMVLTVPFIVVGEIQALCAVLDLHMDSMGKVITLTVGAMAGYLVFIGRLS